MESVHRRHFDAKLSSQGIAASTGLRRMLALEDDVLTAHVRATLGELLRRAEQLNDLVVLGEAASRAKDEFVAVASHGPEHRSTPSSAGCDSSGVVRCHRPSESRR